jgi:uncharacterized membrane protein YdfJ with MMPL/SSD domain
MTGRGAARAANRGFGLGVASLLDATIVRTVLMPAWMELLGDHSWHMPGSLR